MRHLFSLSLALVVALVATTSEATDSSGTADIYVPAVATPWPGKIFVSHDEFLLSDYGYLQTPDAHQLALNVAAWFTGGRPGRFLVHSSHYALTGADLASTMTAAGHTWVVSMDATFTLANLRRYDGVFLAGDPVDNAVLIDYVHAGGHVYLEGGTGIGGNIVEAAHWNHFLNAFGLALGPYYDFGRPPGVYSIVSNSPLFAGVTTLYEDIGNPVVKLDPADPEVQVLVSDNGQALFATYATPVVAVAMEICSGQIVLESDGVLSVVIAGTPDIDVRTIDALSLRLLNVAPRQTAVNYGTSAPSGPRLGKTQPDDCRPGTDRIPDLVAGFRSSDLVHAAEAILGQPLDGGEMLALTLTGRLKPEAGGTPIVGESVVLLKGHAPVLRRIAPVQRRGARSRSCASEAAPSCSGAAGP
jgi:hypothetical protein